MNKKNIKKNIYIETMNNDVLRKKLDGHEFEQTPGTDDGQGGLVFCDSLVHKESDTTERLNCTELTEGKN